MILKIFLFQFVNSYASFFYLAFVAKTMGDCPETGCMGALGTNLAIVFGARIVVAQLKQNVIPYFKYKRRVEKSLELAQGKMTRPEKELQLDEVRTKTNCDQAVYLAKIVILQVMWGRLQCLITRCTSCLFSIFIDWCPFISLF